MLVKLVEFNFLKEFRYSGEDADRSVIFLVCHFILLWTGLTLLSFHSLGHVEDEM